MQRRFGRLLVGALVAGGLTSSSCSRPAPVTARLVVGSALNELCRDAIAPFNDSRPKLANGEPFSVTCDVQPSADIVRELSGLIQGLHEKKIPPTDPRFPTLMVLESDLYHTRLLSRLHQQYPGHNYLSEPNDSKSPLLASSPLVFMARSDLVEGLKKSGDVLKLLRPGLSNREEARKARAEKQPAQPPPGMRYVHANVSTSNAGLEALIMEFASVAGKAPDALTVDDVKMHERDVAQLEARISRYGSSSDRLADDMLKYGPQWATLGAVHETSVLEANRHRAADVPRYDAIYPAAPLAAQMRAVSFNAPWNDTADQEIAETLTKYLLSTDVQKQIAHYGLRPGSPSIPLDAQFTVENGVDPAARFKLAGPAQPEVIDAIIEAWEQRIRKPVQLVVVLSTSSSTQGEKLAAEEDTLRRLLERAGPMVSIQVISFNSRLTEPVAADPADPRGTYQRITGSLKAEGGARLFDAALAARDWLLAHYRPEASHAVLILSDGDDAVSTVQLDRLEAELKKSGFMGGQWISLFAIGYGRDVAGHFERMAELCDLTGGRFVEATPERIQDVIHQF